MGEKDCEDVEQVSLLDNKKLDKQKLNDGDISKKDTVPSSLTKNGWKGEYFYYIPSPPLVFPSPPSLLPPSSTVLLLLAVQNCSKNLIMRYAMQTKPDILYSAAVIGSETTKLTLSILYIVFIDGGSLSSIWNFLKLGEHPHTKVKVATLYRFLLTFGCHRLQEHDPSLCSGHRLQRATDARVRCSF